MFVRIHVDLNAADTFDQLLDVVETAIHPHGIATAKQFGNPTCRVLQRARFYERLLKLLVRVHRVLKPGFN